MDNDLIKRARAARLILAREKLHRTPAEAMRALGVARGTYYGYENGNRLITEAAARRLAPGLQVAPEWLLFGDVQNLEKNLRRLSLFLPNDVLYFSQIRGGASPVSKTMLTVDPQFMSVPERGYFVRAPDNAMARSDERNIPAGAYPLIDPDSRDCRPGALVHAVLAARRTSVVREIRQQMRGDGQTVTVLVPADPAFESIEFSERAGDFIVGEVAWVLVPFLRR